MKKVKESEERREEKWREETRVGRRRGEMWRLCIMKNRIR